MILALLLLLLGCASPAPQARVEGCATCHEASAGPGGAHAALTCDACHLGDPAGATREIAHKGLEREPGALDTVRQTCGSATCHAEQAARVAGSLMATNTGIVATDLAAFGETAPEAATITAVLAKADPSPAEDHLRRLCAGCHLGARSDNRDDALSGVGSGCSSCHSAVGGPGHPSIDLDIPDSRCQGCHSRSSRISLSYAGLSERRGGDCAEPGALPDGRETCRQPEDLHHAAGLGCADCHLHSELMGDGTPHAHESEATELRCETCHGPGAPERPWSQVADPATARLLAQRRQTRVPAEPARLGARGTPVWNLREDDHGAWVLFEKVGSTAHLVKQTPADAEHGLSGHERLSCSACHSRWAPSCPECHTSRQSDGSQWDFGRAAEAPGRWVEQAETFDVAAPALGLRPDGRIGPVIPGMIWTLTQGDRSDEHRWYAAIEPHTTSREGRACADCHASAAALALGTGRLDLTKGSFTPRSPAKEDPGMASDGWSRLWGPPGQGVRPGLRSLNAEEQRRVLRVGLCLPCHGQADDAVYQYLPAAARALAGGRARGCRGRLPAWARQELD